MGNKRIPPAGGLEKKDQAASEHGIPPNNQLCGLCRKSALGFAVFETTVLHEGQLQKSVLPFGWRCYEHRRVTLSDEQWSIVEAEFEKRLGYRPGKGDIVVGISRLTEEQARQLDYLSRHAGGASLEPRKVEVETLGGSDLADAFPELKGPHPGKAPGNVNGGRLH
jgi:hypothetical protein